MTKTVDAIYENGTLRRMKPISLAEGTRVEVIVIASERSAEDRSPSEILAGIESVPMEVGVEDFSGKDQDKILLNS